MIAQLHRDKGFSKSGAEVKSKINNLKTEYRNVKPKLGTIVEFIFHIYITPKSVYVINIYTFI